MICCLWLIVKLCFILDFLKILEALIRIDDSRKRFFNKLCKLMKCWILLAIIQKIIISQKLICSHIRNIRKNNSVEQRVVQFVTIYVASIKSAFKTSNCDYC